MFKPRCERIFDHALKFSTPFRNNRGHAWAIVPDSFGYRGFPISSPGFRRWLTYSFHDEHSVFPSVKALEGAIGMFAVHALRSDYPASDFFTRIGWRGDQRDPQSILLDLNNGRSELVEITAAGHHLVRTESWRFLAGSTTMPLPRPLHNGATLRSHLRPVLKLDGIALERAIVWLFAALRPAGPYPVLVIAGPPASGRSTLALMLRYLIDPSGMAFSVPPANERYLFNLELHNHVLSFDNAAGLPPPMVESIARVATGASFSVFRRDISDVSEQLPLARPMILTSNTTDPLTSFSDVAMRIDLAGRKAEDVLTQASLAEQYQDAAPQILGTLCAAATAALSNTTATSTPPVSRFAEVQKWTMAAAPILGLTNQQIIRALAANPQLEQTPEITFGKAHS